MINKEQIGSAVIENQNLGLYKVVLPGIKRYFEGVYYSFEGKNKQYGNILNEFNNINLSNKLVGVTRFNNYYIICFINLNTLESFYYFVRSYTIIEVKLEEKKYNAFIYENIKGNVKCICNYKGNDYKFSAKDRFFVVKNKIYDTEVQYEMISLDNNLLDFGLKISKKSDDEKFIDIFDFFIYEDYFLKSNKKNYENFYSFLEQLDKKVLKINPNLKIKLKLTKYDESYYPKIKINVKVNTIDTESINLDDIRKLMLSFFAENTSCYISDNSFVKADFFEYFNDFTSLEYDKLRLKFYIPDSIYTCNDIYDKFKLNLLKLRYNLFLLEQFYNNKNNKVKEKGKYLNYLKTKEELNNDSLEKIIKSYEKLLAKLLENTSKIVDYNNRLN